MSVDLKQFLQNEQEKSDTLIFNDGVAGKVKNVTLSLQKKTPNDKPNAPDFKVFLTDEKGGQVNKGFYFPDEKTSPGRIAIELSQLVEFLVALNPAVKDENLPEQATPRVAYEYLFKRIAASNPASKRVNVFVSYGTKSKPSSYLGFRAYDIVEPANTPDQESSLVPKVYSAPPKDAYNDIMERPRPTTFPPAETKTSEGEVSDDTSYEWED